jgi:hypothetical protein
MMLKICPATSNLPTVMTAASWKALCKATFKKETAVTMSGFHRVASESYCSKCQGKTKPPKLKIVSPEEMLAKTPTNKELPMTTKVSNRGTCDCCEDKNLVLRNNYNKKMCGKCASMYSNVRNYLPIIEMALAELWPDKYGPNAKQLAASNPDAVKVAVDEKTEATLKRIAALVGYGGDDPEEMVEHVAGVIVENGQLWKDLGLNRLASARLAQRESALWELVNAMEDIVDDRDEIYHLYNELFYAYKEETGSNESNNNLTTTQQAIANQCDHLKQTLLDKNRKYGNSALEPVRLFSKADPVEQIRVRIDDKLSRLQSAQIDDTEDVELDLAGYLVLLKVAKRAA